LGKWGKARAEPGGAKAHRGTKQDGQSVKNGVGKGARRNLGFTGGGTSTAQASRGKKR